MLDARYRKRVFRTIKKISLHDILTFDTGLPRFDLSLSCRINASYRSKRGLHEYKKELRINAEFNYQLSLSLSLFLFQSKLAPSRSRFKWTRNIWCGERVFHGNLFIVPTSLQRVSTLECRYKLAETLIQSTAYFYTSTSIARFISPIVDIMITRFFSTRVISLQLPLDFFLVFKNTSSVHVTSFDNHQFAGIS